MPQSEPAPTPTRDLVDHLQARIAGLEADRAESDVRWRRVADALGLEGDPMDEVIVARAEAVRREMELRRKRIEHLRIALSDIVEDGDPTARELARSALEADLDARAGVPARGAPSSGMSPETLSRAIDECEVLAVGLPMGAPARDHLLTMPGRMRGLVAQGRREKVMRWLGFMQGAFWALGAADLETLKRMNMPPDAAYDAARDRGSNGEG